MFEETISLLSVWASMNSWLTPTVLFLLLNLMIGTIAFTSGFTSHKPSHHHNNNNHIHGHNYNHHYHHHIQTQLTRSPSVLQRLKSINFNFYPYIHTQQQPHTTVLERKPSWEERETATTTANYPQTTVLQRLKSLSFYSHPQKDQTQQHPHEPQQESHPVPERESEEREIPDVGLEDEGPTMEEIYNQIVKKGNSSLYGRQNSDTKPSNGEVPVKLPRKMKKMASDKSAFNHFKAVEERENDGRGGGALAEMVAEEVEHEERENEVDARADDFINRFKAQLKMQRLESIVRQKDVNI